MAPIVAMILKMVIGKAMSQNRGSGGGQGNPIGSMIADKYTSSIGNSSGAADTREISPAFVEAISKGDTATTIKPYGDDRKGVGRFFLGSNGIDAKNATTINAVRAKQIEDALSFKQKALEREAETLKLKDLEKTRTDEALRKIKEESTLKRQYSDEDEARLGRAYSQDIGKGIPASEIPTNIASDYGAIARLMQTRRGAFLNQGTVAGIPASDAASKLSLNQIAEHSARAPYVGDIAGTEAQASLMGANTSLTKAGLENSFYSSPKGQDLFSVALEDKLNPPTTIGQGQRIIDWRRGLDIEGGHNEQVTTPGAILFKGTKNEYQMPETSSTIYRAGRMSPLQRGLGGGKGLSSTIEPTQEFGGAYKDDFLDFYDLPSPTPAKAQTTIKTENPYSNAKSLRDIYNLSGGNLNKPIDSSLQRANTDPAAETELFFDTTTGTWKARNKKTGEVISQ
jgi:hypothetical protein